MRVPVRSLAVLTVVLVATGCTNLGSADDDDAESGEEASELPEVVVTEPLSPFCQGIVDLEVTLAADPDLDSAVLILATYEELLPVAPAQIADDLAAIIAGDGGQEEVIATEPPPADVDEDAPPGTDIDAPNEGFGPPATPAGRVATYIQSECDGVSSNPGPPPTVPFSEPPPADEASE